MNDELHRIMMERFVAEKREKVERYRHLDKFVKPHQILFAGSSLMEQFPIYELILDMQLPYIIYNRGIGGYTTQELLETMDVFIYDLEPDYIYINIGTNDLNEPDYNEDELIKRYRNIIGSIREHLPGSKLNLLAYFPVNPSAAPDDHMREIYRWRTNDRIRSANAAVEQLAHETGNNFIDLNEGITDENGELRIEYTIDGMHMYGDGYIPVLNALLPHLPK
jgi:lysophospholipase L1-like esterase